MRPLIKPKPYHVKWLDKELCMFERMIYFYTMSRKWNLMVRKNKGKKKRWNQYSQIITTFRSRKLSIVYPDFPAKGNPWVWRARFPDFHTELDIVLLGRGFHIVHLDMENLHGGPASIALWDALYKEMTKKKGLATKVTLEGVSRGGLSLYNWATLNPEKIDSIYADTPVCDIKSWPLGSQSGKFSKPDWNLILDEYHLSHEKALEFKGNPIDNLKPLADHKIPIMHVIGVNDTVVPPAENTDIMKKNYDSLGGEMVVLRNQFGIEETEGHHFTPDSPDKGVDFILNNCSVIKGTPDDQSYCRFRGNFINSKIKFTRTKKGTVAFLGGSITQAPGWRTKIMKYISHKFLKSKIKFIGAGIGSTDSSFGAFRVNRDIFSKGMIDVLFVEYAVNDFHNGRSSSESIKGLEGIIRQAYLHNPLIDIVLMYFIDPSYMPLINAGQIPPVINSHQQVAEYYHISSINLAAEVTERITAKEFSWKRDFKDLHPSPFGQKVYFRAIRRFLDYAWIKTIDANDTVKIHHTISEIPPLDDFNYENAKMIDISEAVIKQGWQVIRKWNPRDRYGKREGFVNVPILQAETPGALLEFEFTGRAVCLVILASPDIGIIEYSIDGEAKRTIDMFTQWSTDLHLPWFLKLENELSKGNHVLSLGISKEKNSKSKGNACRIVSFCVN